MSLNKCPGAYLRSRLNQEGCLLKGGHLIVGRHFVNEVALETGVP